MFGEFDGKPTPLTDTFRIAHPTPTKEEGTSNGFDATRTTGARIDWIGCTKEWETRSAGIDRAARNGRTPSDHYAIFAVLKPKK